MHKTTTEFLLELYKPLTRAEEIDAWERGDANALVCSQLAYIIKICGRLAYKSGRDDMMDEMISACLAAMVNCVKKYDGGNYRLTTFTTKVVFWRAIKERDVILKGVGPKKKSKAGRKGIRTREVGDEYLRKGYYGAVVRDTTEEVVEREQSSLESKLFWGAVDKLSDREQEVIRKIANGETLQRTGDSLGITKERVRQIKEGSLKKIAKTIGAEVAA